MRHATVFSAVLALSAALLAACDDDAGPARTAATATADQCRPAPVPACPATSAAGSIAPTARAASGASATRATSGVYPQAAGGKTWGERRHASRRDRRAYAAVEHYGYLEGARSGSGEAVYASGATTRSSRTVISSVSRTSESGYSYQESASGYAAQGGHRGRLVIRDENGQAEGWTWRTAGRDEDGYLVWPGKSPD